MSIRQKTKLNGKRKYENIWNDELNAFDNSIANTTKTYFDAR